VQKIHTGNRNQVAAPFNDPFLDGPNGLDLLLFRRTPHTCSRCYLSQSWILSPHYIRFTTAFSVPDCSPFTESVVLSVYYGFPFSFDLRMEFLCAIDLTLSRQDGITVKTRFAVDTTDMTSVSKSSSICASAIPKLQYVRERPVCEIIWHGIGKEPQIYT